MSLGSVVGGGYLTLYLNTCGMCLDPRQTFCAVCVLSHLIPPTLLLIEGFLSHFTKEEMNSLSSQVTVPRTGSYKNARFV